jgi:hypothetical protein
MNITIYEGDNERFRGKIDDKPFDFTVEEFVNLLGAFQETVYRAQGIDIPEEDKISAKIVQDELDRKESCEHEEDYNNKAKMRDELISISKKDKS